MGASQIEKAMNGGLKNHIMNLTTQCHILPDGKNILWRWTKPPQIIFVLYNLVNKEHQATLAKRNHWL